MLYLFSEVPFMRPFFLILAASTTLLAEQVLTEPVQCDVLVSDDLEYDCQESIQFLGQFVLTDSMVVDSIKMKGLLNDKAEGHKLH